KGYTGFVEFDDESQVFFGRVIGLRDVITFEGKSVAEVVEAYRLRSAEGQIQVSPDYFAPQYSGHSAASCARPRSARARSVLASSLAHSRARRIPARRSSLSRMATWTA